jgi:hypothetical protein
MARLPACFATVTLIALAGCGQLAIKRGSGAEALAAERESCRAQDADPTAVRACLVAHGWQITVVKAGSVALPAYNPAAIPQPAPADASSDVPPVEAPKEIHVGNWWHFGGGPADLHAAVDGCVSKIGASDRPDARFHTVSRALYGCLSAAGWRSMGSPAYGNYANPDPTT